MFGCDANIRRYGCVMATLHGAGACWLCIVVAYGATGNVSGICCGGQILSRIHMTVGSIGGRCLKRRTNAGTLRMRCGGVALAETAQAAYVHKVCVASSFRALAEVVRLALVDMLLLVGEHSLISVHACTKKSPFWAQGL